MNEAPKFGKYTVLRRIGAGGMAEVFKCRLSGIGGFDKVVVVKRILPDLADDPQFVNMFLDEARVAANLSHPNIIQIYEIDEVDGVPYIAMEYVRGPTFSQMIREARKRAVPNYAVAAKVMSGICEALHYAHNAVDGQGQALGIIHRDVSPQNILVTLDGLPKLLDFGVAKARGQLALTNAGTVKGKLKFMAPEQLHSKVGFDHRVDIFSAGVCLYQASTFKLPYSGDTEIDVMRAAATGEYLKPSELVPDFPKELEKIILWAMAPNPADRCPDGHTLHEALEGWLAHQPSQCTAWSVRHYIRELFPDVENSGVMGTAYAGDPISSNKFMPPSQSKVSRVGPPPLPKKTKDEPIEIEVLSEVRPPRRSFTPLFAVLGVVAVGLLAALVVRARAPDPTVAAPAVAQPSLTPLLDEAERALDQNRHVAAGELIDSARSLAQNSHQKDARLDDLRKRWVHAQSLVKAKEALAKGQLVEARLLARQVLAERSDHPGALALLQEVMEREKAKPAEPARPVERTGVLAIVTDPPAQVTVDDVTLGMSPIRKYVVSEGNHVVLARLDGHNSIERTIRVQAGKESSVRIRLPREARREERLVRIAEPAAPAPAAPSSPPQTHPVAKAEEPAVEVREPLEPLVAARNDQAPPPAPVPAPVPVAGGNAAPVAAVSVSLDCPESAHVSGAGPPRGTQIWCELADGSRHGRYVRFFASGRKAEEGEYRNGKKHGRWIEFYEAGGERERTEWRKGVKSW